MCAPPGIACSWLCPGNGCTIINIYQSLLADYLGSTDLTISGFEGGPDGLVIPVNLSLQRGLLHI